MSLKMNNKFKLIILVFLPFIIGFSIERLLAVGITGDNQLYLNLSSILLSLWIHGGGIVFWFCVGRMFGNLNMSTVKSFILGNIAWGISVILYTWQFKLVDDTSRNLFISAISQHYPLGFVSLGSSIIGMFTRHLKGTTVILIAYFLMLMVFSLGFISTVRSKIIKPN